MSGIKFNNSVIKPTPGGHTVPVPACRAGCEETGTTGSEGLREQSCPSSLDNQRAYWMFEDL